MNQEEKLDKINEIGEKLSLVYEIRKIDKDFLLSNVSKIEKTMLEEALTLTQKNRGDEKPPFKEEPLSKAKIINKLKNLGMSQEEINPLWPTGHCFLS